MAKKNKSQKDIITAYMQHVLEHSSTPESVYKFGKDNGFTEAEFYNFFGTFESLEKSIFSNFFDNTMMLLEKNEEYQNFDAQNKLLSFYFTFFEVLLLNRSYVLFSLKGSESTMTAIGQLKHLRSSFKAFTTELIEEGNDDKSLSLAKHPVGLFSEAAWSQLLFILKFWLDDTSPAFEKTDAAIEKSITVAFDVFDNTQLEALVDLGKFLWKEKISKN